MIYLSDGNTDVLGALRHWQHQLFSRSIHSEDGGAIAAEDAACLSHNIIGSLINARHRSVHMVLELEDK